MTETVALIKPGLDDARVFLGDQRNVPITETHLIPEAEAQTLLDRLIYPVPGEICLCRGEMVVVRRWYTNPLCEYHNPVVEGVDGEEQYESVFHLEALS